jgi:hypothetical protein
MKVAEVTRLILLVISIIYGFIGFYYAVWALISESKMHEHRRYARKERIILDRYKMYRYYRYGNYISCKRGKRCTLIFVTILFIFIILS